MTRESTPPPARRWTRPAARTLTVLAFTLAGLLIGGTYWISQYFGTLNMDEVLFTLATGRENTTAELHSEILNNVIAPTVCAFLLGIVVATWDLRLTIGEVSRRALTLSATLLRRTATVLGVIALVGGGAYFWNVVPIRDYLFPPDASPFIEDNYVAPSQSNVSFQGDKRNLIHIMVESLENTFYDTAQGGAMAQNLMPDLGQLSDENISFSHTEAKGGFHQVRGATFTTGGLVTMSSGVPLLSGALENQAVQSFVFPDFTALGDILAQNGYTNELMTGANADFGSKREYFTTHGSFSIFDHAYATQNGYIPSDYHTWWGYEDDKEYEFAKQEVTRLAAQDKPFYFLLETADTHFPGGYLEPGAEQPFAQQYANVVFHSQKQVTAFVRWVQQQSFYDSTTILITGDHLSMETDFFDEVGLDPSYDRTVTNILINPAPQVAGVSRERTTNRTFATFDMFPTTLAAIGATIKGDRLGLGTNLFSQTPTLMESLGREKVEKELEAPSVFYNKHKIQR